MGVYILFLDTHNRLNRQFFLISISLGIWAFSFAMANATSDFQTALFFRKVAALGWGSIFSLILHFLFIFTEQKRILQKKWPFVLLYLPSAITIFVFFLIEDVADKQFNLQYTKVGWVNISVNNFWDIFYNVYYLGCTIFTLLFLSLWLKKSTEHYKKKQARILIVSFGITMVLGTFTEMVINAFTSVRSPQIAPLLSMIPVVAIYYAIKKYGFMRPKVVEKTSDGSILNEKNRKKLFQSMSVVFVVGGLVNFISQFYFTPDSFQSIVLYSLIYITIGLFLQIVQRINIDEKWKELFFTILIVCSIPLLTLHYVEFAGATIWAVPVMFLLISVVFNKRSLLFGILIITILQQLWFIYYKPATLVEINNADFIGRIGIITIAAWVAFYVNKMYINRLKENYEQFHFQEMISKISADFINISEENLDEKINGFLESSGNYFLADYSFYISLTEEFKSYEWHMEKLNPSLEMILELGKNNYAWWNEQMNLKKLICIMDVNNMPQEAWAEKQELIKRGIMALVSMPIIRKDLNLGYLLFVSMKPIKAGIEKHKEMLMILTNLLADGLIKVEAEKEINYMAYYDLLTGIPNRALFKNRLEQAIQTAKRNSNLVAVMFIDLDAFKAVNDALGHFGGNELLKTVAKRLTTCLRKQDTVARFGGDEFLVQVTQIENSLDIDTIAKKLINSISKPIYINEQEFFVTASIGIAVCPVDGEDSELLIKNADLAMYQAKERGKNQYLFCTFDMKKDILNKMKLTNHLYRALEKKELELYYQPQINVATREIVGIEALLRWNHSELGLLGPGTFIPIAEQTGLILEMGRWVLETACKQNKKWQNMGLPFFRMAVNLSVEQFRDKKLTSSIAKIIDDTQMDARYLELEITESTAIQTDKHAINMLQDLKNLGTYISIDDFGAEYSSMGRLRDLPIDQLKIDIQFIRNIINGEKDKAIVKTIIQLCKNLELNVIAEGVETEEQLAFLEEQGCDEIQGYYFYKPMPAREMEAELIRRYGDFEGPKAL